ncbi:MAG: hypothetical protein ACK40G_00870 [Cytophagaceae bacterium]
MFSVFEWIVLISFSSIVFFFLNKIVRLCRYKGLNPLKWSAYALIAWFSGEFFGIYLVIKYIGENYRLFAIIFGPGVGYLFYLLVRQALDSRPDIEQ